MKNSARVFVNRTSQRECTIVESHYHLVVHHHEPEKLSSHDSDVVLKPPVQPMTVYNVKAAFQYLNGAVHLVHLKFTHQGEYGHHNNHVSQCLESLAEEILPEMLCLLEEIPVVGPVVRLAADLAEHGSMEDTDFDVMVEVRRDASVYLSLECYLWWSLHSTV